MNGTETRAGKPRRPYHLKSTIPDGERRLIEAELSGYISAREVEEIYGVARMTINEALRRGWIVGRRSGATWIMRRSDADARWGTGRKVLTWSAGE